MQTPDDFIAADLEKGYTSVTPRLHIGTPPFTCVWTRSVTLATTLLQGELIQNVTVPGSAEARMVLRNLGVDEAEIIMKLRVARYGVYEVLNP
jgi:hypothetical protein